MMKNFRISAFTNLIMEELMKNESQYLPIINKEFDKIASETMEKMLDTGILEYNPCVTITTKDGVINIHKEKDAVKIINMENFQLMPLEEEEINADLNFEIVDEIIANRSESSGSDEVIDRQITYHELAMMEPIIQRKVVLVNSDLPYNIGLIMQKGNPTRYILEKYFVTESILKGISNF
jgi:hypothetical protein